MNNPNWISEGAETLAAGLLHRMGDGVDFDVVIVGSGYGGAVAAYKLAGAKKDGKPIRVAVLERGFEYVPGTFPERFADAPGFTRINSVGEAPGARNGHGLFDFRIGAVSALVGNGLGGGSLINASVLAEPTPETFRKPGWPASISSEVLAPHFREVKKTLGAATMPTAQLPEKFRALERLGRGYGDQGAPGAQPVELAVTFKAGPTFAGVQQNPCIACGNCVSGCNHRAKNTLATNYLPAAFRRGAQLFTGVTVQRIGRRADGTWHIHWGFTEAQVADRFSTLPQVSDKVEPLSAESLSAESLSTQKKRVLPPAIRARWVILAGGTYGSTEILLRSSPDPDPDPYAPADPEAITLSAAVGSRFSTNGENIAVAYATGHQANSAAREDHPPDKRDVGPTITGMIDRRRGDSGYVVQEFGIPAPLRRVFEEISTTTGMLHALGEWDPGRHDASSGQDPAAVDDARIDNTPVFGFIGHDDARGKLRLMGMKKSELLDGALTADWPGSPEPALDPYFLGPYREVQTAHKKSGAGGVVIPNPLWKVLPDSLDGVLEFKSGGALFTTHPLGGCPMADDAAHGAVNALGQVYCGATGTDVHKTLAVLDGSIMPSSLGINPSLTIAALASHALDGLCTAWGLTPLDAASLPKELPPTPAVKPRNSWEAPRRSTGVGYAEVFKGQLEFDRVEGAAPGSGAVEATLQLQFEPIKDLWDFTRKLDRQLDVKRGTLWLTIPAALQPQVVEVPVRGSVNLLSREPTRPLGRVLRAGWAWLLNRGVRDILEFLGKKLSLERLGSLEPQDPPRAGLLKMLKGLAITLNNAGERRLFEYVLTIEKDIDVRGRRLFDAGDRITGAKLIAYRHRSNPWTQSNELPVEVTGAKGGRRARGLFVIDPIFAVRTHAVQLQITGQQDQPTALADIFSFGAFLARLVLKLHFYTFRAPQYPDDAPRQAMNKRIRDHVEERRNRSNRFLCADQTRLPTSVSGIAPVVTWHRMKRALVLKDQPVLKEQPPDLTDPSETVDPVDLDRSFGYFRLCRYQGPSGSAPVLLIHGFGAGSPTFTTDTITNLAQHLLAGRHDVWVIDLPTSIAMGGSHVEWAFERASRAVGEALQHISKQCGGGKVNVVAHCIGGSMFLMSVLRELTRKEKEEKDKEKEPHELVNAAVLTQSGPIVRVPPLNGLRGFFAGYLKAFLNSAMKAEFDATSEHTTMERMIDRLLVAYPYEPEEWAVYNPLLPCKVLDNEAYFHRANAIWGKLFEVTNLGPATRSKLGDLIGHVNARAMQQTVLFMHMRRVCDVLGENTFVTTKQIAKQLHFPICLIHGKKNAVFEAEGAEESFRFIARARGQLDTLQALDDAPDEAARKKIYEESWSLRLILQPGYGHQDLVFGERAHEHVFPKISEFFDKAAPVPAAKSERRATIVRFPRLGPVLGSLLTPPDGAGGPPRVKVLLIGDDLESTPNAAAAIVVMDGVVQPELTLIASSEAILQKAVNLWNIDERASNVINPDGYYGNAPARTWALDVALPGHRAWKELSVYCVTLHEEHPDTAARTDFGSRADPSRLAHEPKFAFPVELKNGEPLDEVLTALQVLQGGGASAAQTSLVHEWADAVVEGCDERIAYAENVKSDESVADLTYQWQMPHCKLVPSMLASAPAAGSSAPATLAFALGSCRYSASIFDREAADASFGRLRAGLERAGSGAKPEFLLLVGDQIYSDATAGVFDPTVGVERYDWAYHEVWSSPHARAVLRALPTYMMLDDHELANNIEPALDEVSAIVRRGFLCYLLYQMRLRPRGISDPLFHYTFDVRGLPFFVCDTRIPRYRRLLSGSLEGDIMYSGSFNDLLRWLELQQALAPGAPKFVVSPVAVFPWQIASAGHVMNTLRSDSWDSFPQSLGALLHFIAEKEIDNVVFLSGDYHCSLVARADIGLTNGTGRRVTAYSIVSSGLYSPYPFANTDLNRLARCFVGKLSDWYGPTYNGKADVDLSYDIVAETDRDGFATIAVRGSASAPYELDIEFNTDEKPVHCCLVLR